MYDGVNWLHLAEYRVKQTAVVNTARKFRFPKKAGDFSPPEPLSVSK
jgi:hypothetical protein